MYDNIIFDVYGTMIDIWTDEESSSTWHQIAPLFHFYGVNLLPQQIKTLFFEGCAKNLAKGKKRFTNPEIDVVSVFYDILATQNKASKSLAKQLAQAFRVASYRKIQLFDGVLQTLETLKNSGKKLYILSNAQACFTTPELKRFGLTKYFRGIALSSNYKVAKPDKEFFEAFLEKYKLNKSACIYVGNDLNSDICGANAVGMDCIWLNTGRLHNDTNHTPTHTIDNGDFTKILDIVK